ncbi:hypothetical protein FRC03_010724 [Tulasnella sp. 419]|nr:hypothetical protein FRC03_010724 [Tulasnella sp. 419]
MLVSGYFLDITNTTDSENHSQIPYKSTSHLAVGVGYYGTVHRCVAGEHFQTEVAVKYLKPGVCIHTCHGQFATQADIAQRYRKRIRREFDIWKDLRHKNIAPLLGYWIDEDPTNRLCLVTKYYKKGSIIHHTRGFPVSLKLQFLRGAAKGLAYLHSKDIVHNDIKAANILVDDNDTAVLIDFGVSFHMKKQDTSSSSNKSEGRPWLPPERVLPENYSSGNGLPNPTTDTWSFGCTVLEVVSEQLPWIRYSADPHNMLTIAMHPDRQERPGIPAEYPLMPDSLWKFCNTCWNYQADKRPTLDDICSELKSIKRWAAFKEKFD